MDVGQLRFEPVSAPPSIPSSRVRGRPAVRRRTPHLLAAEALVCVVQPVGDDVSVPGQGFVPAQGHGGGRVGRRPQVGSRAWHLDWKRRRKRRIGPAQQPFRGQESNSGTPPTAAKHPPLPARPPSLPPSLPAAMLNSLHSRDKRPEYLFFRPRLPPAFPRLAAERLQSTQTQIFSGTVDCVTLSPRRGGAPGCC